MDLTLSLLYSWTRGARASLLEFLDTLPVEVLLSERDEFAHGSLRNVAAHVVECYQFWIGEVGLGRSQAPRRPETVEELREAFSEVDALMAEALLWEALDAPLVWKGHRITRRWLICHTITHEFHHKGQLLAMARMLGHPLPPDRDTDIPFLTSSA